MRASILADCRGTATARRFDFRRDACAPPQTPRETSPASARRCSCCSASSDSCRTAPARRSRARPPCPNGAAARFGAERLHRGLMRDAAERHDGAQVRHLGDGRRRGTSRQVLISAGVGLFSGGTQRTALVMRASTSSSAVVGPRLVVAAGEAEFDQRRVEQVAGIVAGERPAGAVGAAQAGREADDQQPRVERPEGRHRRVEPVRLALAPVSRNATSRGQSGQSRPGLAALPAMTGHCADSGRPINPRNRRRRRAGALRRGRCAAGIAACAGARRAARAIGVARRALGRVAADLALQLDDVE